MAKPELGTKRVCPSCGTKYYDLSRNPIVCPSCGTVFVVAPRLSGRRRTEAGAGAEGCARRGRRGDRAATSDVVSLEEVEEGAEPDVGPDVDAEDEEPVVPERRDRGRGGPDAVPDPFLEEEEEGNDVAGLLDVDAEPEEER